MQHYHDLIAHVLQNGKVKTDRTGTGTISVFGHQSRMDLADGFPLLTTKRIHWKSVMHELLWFISGSTSIRPLLLNGVKIWSDWPHATYVRETGDRITLREFEARILADSAFSTRWGDLGPVYGRQWRRWSGEGGKEFDQLGEVVHLLRTQPDSRRILMSAWKVDCLSEMALPPCHLLVQFGVSEGKLDCHLYQRSADLFLGVPFNIASYALLTHMLAQVSGLQPGSLIHSYGDLHVYRNHLDQVNEQLTRMPKGLPTLQLDPTIREIDDFQPEHICINNYDPWPSIKASVAV